MKIGILTQPLSSNYGGIIQNYALQTFLMREGHDVHTIERRSSDQPALRFGSVIKRGLIKFISRKDIVLRVWPTKKELAVINQNTDRFIKDHIIQTETFHKKKFDLLKKYSFDAYIVGSDQVWRPKYSPCLTNYFLDFLDGNNEVKKIAYAASFGVDDWEYTPEQTKICSSLAKQFNAISVREDSAVELCKKHFGVEATHVLDPSMLLTKEDYIHLIKEDNIPERENILFNYILDQTEKKNTFIQKAADAFKIQSVSGMPPNKIYWKKNKKDLSDCVYHPVTEWLAGFKDAKLVVTDSFHGCVFSILFNKPFIVFSNELRGNARLNSLLKMFNLEGRLYKEMDADSKLLYMDYSDVNRILEKERKKSIAFLLDALE